MTKTPQEATKYCFKCRTPLLSSVENYYMLCDMCRGVACAEDPAHQDAESEPTALANHQGDHDQQNDEAKHTPGPWKATRLNPDNHGIITETAWEIRTPAYNVAAMFRTRGPIRKEADARLIAKAPLVPVLLEALEGILGYAEQRLTAAKGDPSAERLIGLRVDKARAAIAAATD